MAKQNLKGRLMVNLIALIILEVFLFLVAFYFSEQDVMAPSCMMCIMFIISTTVAFLNVKNWNINFSADTVFLVFSGLLAFIVGEVMFRFLFCGHLRGKQIIYEEYDDTVITINSCVLVLIIIFDIIVIYLHLQNIIRLVGGSMTSISSYFHAYRVMGIKSLDSGEASNTSGLLNLALKFVIAFGYMSGYMLMRNLVIKGTPVKEQIKYASITVLSILPSLMSGGRSGFLKMFAALLIYYYICWHQKNGWRRNLSWKYIRLGLVTFFAMAPAFYFSLGLLGRQTNRGFTEYVSGYIGSSIYLLDKYLKAPTSCELWGEESLASMRKILSAIGMGMPSTKYNLEFRTIGANASNVYTFFRRPLHDFGLIGMYVFVILIAFLFAWIYYRRIKYQLRSKCEGWVIAYGYLYYWLLCSSIEQYSVNMISAGAISQIFIAVIAYKILNMYSTYRET